jgi:hypothetical protein
LVKVEIGEVLRFRFYFGAVRGHRLVEKDALKR